MLNFLKSTIVAKVVMAVTGLIIVGFLFGHALGNLQFFLGSDPYNTYAAFLQGLGEILWGIRAFLILSIILHIISGVYLRIYNNAAKPEHYKIKHYVKSKLTARTMLWTGILIAAGLTYHLLHFTTGNINFEGGYDHYEIVPTGEYAFIDDNGAAHEAGGCEGCTGNPTTCQDVKNCLEDGCFDDTLVPVLKERHDVHTMVATEFGNPIVVISYLVFVILVGFHLNHAIQSALHTLGIQGPKLTPCLNKLSVLLSVALVLLFTVLPISVMLGLVGGGF